MKNYKILDSYNDIDKWLELINTKDFAHLDIYFLPDYINLYTNKFNDGLIFYYSEDEKKWFIPFLKKKIIINNKVFDEYYDLETPYGYSGPVSNSKDKNFLTKATNSFLMWCKSEKITNLIIKFNPILKNEVFFMDEDLILDRETLEIDLSKNNFSYEKFLHSMVKRNINRATRDKVKIKIENSKNIISKIKEIYFKKMKSLKAHEFYFFDDEYFYKLMNLVTNNGWCITAYSNTDLLGFAIFLNYNKKSTYHLSATDVSSKHQGITNSLINKAVELAKLNGFNSINLGGGRTNSKDDGLFKFKFRMSNKQNEYFIYKKVLDEKAYETILNYWKKEYPQLNQKYPNYLQRYRLIK